MPEVIVVIVVVELCLSLVCFGGVCNGSSKRLFFGLYYNRSSDVEYSLFSVS